MGVTCEVAGCLPGWESVAANVFNQVYTFVGIVKIILINWLSKS